MTIPRLLASSLRLNYSCDGSSNFYESEARRKRRLGELVEDDALDALRNAKLLLAILIDERAFRT